MAEVSDQRLRAMFADERKALVAEIQTATNALMRGMQEANRPLERDLGELRHEFKALAVTVADHETRLATGDVVFEAIKESIDRLTKRDSQDQRQELRRSDDLARQVAAAWVAHAAERPAGDRIAVGEKSDTGENRKLTMFHIYLVLGTATAVISVLKFIGKL